MDLEQQVHELVNRVAALENSLATVVAEQQQSISSPAVITTARAAQIPPAPPFAETPSRIPPPPPVGTKPNSTLAAPPSVPHPLPTTPVRSFDWGIESVLRWAGVALVTLAAIFLVSTAINRGWIGPELQLFGAALGGFALLAGAVRLETDRRPWALALGSGGAVVLASCAVATHEWLDVVGPGVAVALVGAATAISVAVALRTRLEGIALVAAVFGLFAPFDTLDQFGDAAILAWICAFIIGSSLLGWFKSWPAVRLVTGWLGAMVLVAYALNEQAEGALQVAGFIGAAVVGTALWAGPTIASQFGPPGQPQSTGSFDWTAIDYRLVAVVPAWVATVVAGLLTIDTNRSYGIVAILAAVGFLALAEATFGIVKRLISVSTFLGAFSVLAVGFALFFEWPALMVALVAQAAVSYYLADRLSDAPLRYGSYVAGLLASLLAGAAIIEAIDNEGFENAGYIFSTGLVLAAWIGAAIAVHWRKDHEIPFDLPFGGSWIGLMAWLAAVLLAVPQGLVMVSVAWTVLACVGLVVGLTRRVDLVKNAALGTLGVTLAKLFTVDLAEVDVFWRVGLFFVVGTGLITLGLKLPTLIGEVEPAEEPPLPSQPGSDAEITDPEVTTF